MSNVYSMLILITLLFVIVIVSLQIPIHEHVFPNLKVYFSNSLFPPIVDCMLCVAEKRIKHKYKYKFQCNLNRIEGPLKSGAPREKIWSLFYNAKIICVGRV